MHLKITKFVHSCLLVETDGRMALFDPGVMSAEAVGQHRFDKLDDIMITHVHGDHMDAALIKRLIDSFPTVRVTGTKEVADSLLKDAAVKATTTPPAGVVFFDSPHEDVKPLFPQPQENGIHYLDVLSHPGDSHSFHETKAILALPITAPWGSTIKALNLALELKPVHVLPIHDWHWNDQARAQTYDTFEKILGQQGITFHKLATGQPVDITL